jgi:apolipoprotein N-acyltransferase
MKVVVSVAAALASALLLWASSPAVGLGWLAWVAIAPVAAVSFYAQGRAARLAVPLAYALYLELLLIPALPFGLDRNQWGEPVVPILVGDSPVVPVAFVAIPAFALLLYAVRFPQLVPCVTHGIGAAACILVPALAWTALDLVRTKADPSGLWGPLYLSQHDTDAGGLVALGGPWLLTFEIVACNFALALLAVRGRAVLAPVATAVAVALLPLGVLAALDEGGGDRLRIRVAAVQPGYDTSEFGLPVLHYLRRAHRNHERATRDLIGDLAPLTRAAAADGARVVVWPEATAWVDPGRNVLAAQTLAALARNTGSALVVPFFQRGPAQSAATVVRVDGNVTRVQPKQRPMWFLGEDDGNRAPARPVSLAAGGFPALRLGTLLGVDNQDPAPARVLTARGADVLASSTHDWEEMAVQQRAFSRLHAVALRVPLVRADWRYGSAIIDADGDIVADAPPGKQRAAVVADVTVGTGATAFARVGDVVGWTALLVAAGLWLLARARAVVRARAIAGSQHPAPARGR